MRWAGINPTRFFESTLFVLLTFLSMVNIYLAFKENDRWFNRLRNWFKVDVALDMAYLFPVSLLVFDNSSLINEFNTLTYLLAARHMYRIRAFLDDFPSIPPIMQRLTPVFFGLPLLVHIFACLWIALGGGSAGLTGDPFYNYIKAFYWAVTTLTTVGYGDITPVTPIQMLFASVTQVIGLGVFGYVLSNVASLLARYNAARENYMENLDRIETFMRSYKTPYHLRTQIRDYYQYLWQTKKGYLDKTLLKDLPLKLQSDLLLNINHSIIEKVPFFRGAEAELLHELMTKLKPAVLVPNEIIFKVGDAADKLYFIQSGQVEILTSQKKHIAFLNDGTLFGEMGLISNRRRIAYAIARSYCDIYYLDKESFEEVANSYPSFRTHLEDIIHERNAA
ncbi:MAG: cyclic nucleotide-binding domain-containing protein [Bdellovibrionales bacterium]|nr:cyclic nucleotide-binding domain-containing protein [Bdellovibrionales bacterium]NQZ19269.1 cyclic nucleotide-binding domain-containing protein [Bdellovibrionales bacterium]